jgi:hypothetical protein
MRQSNSPFQASITASHPSKTICLRVLRVLRKKLPDISRMILYHKTLPPKHGKAPGKRDQH